MSKNHPQPANYASALLWQQDDPVVQALSAGGIGVWQWDVAGDRLLVSGGVADIIDLPPDRACPLADFLALVHEDDRNRVEEVLRTARQDNGSYAVEFRVLAPDKRYHRVRSGGKIVAVPGSKRNYLLSTMQAVDAPDSDPSPRHSTDTDSSRGSKAERALHDTAIAIAATTGKDFFRTLVRQLVHSFDADYAFIGKLGEQTPEIVNTEVMYTPQGFVDGFTYNLENTPCNEVLDQKTRIYPHSVKQHFPRDKLLVDMDIEAYCGSPLIASNGKYIGILVILSRRPIADIGSMEAVLNFFAARVAAEIERGNVEQSLRDSEQQYRDIFNTVQDGLVIDRLDGTIAEANPAACRMHGYTREEFLKLTPPDVIHPDSHSVFRDFLRTLEEGKDFTAIAKELRKDGSWFYIEVHGSKIQYRGEPHFLAVLRDITERKKTEQIIEESRNMLAKAQEISHVGSWSWDLQTGAISWSDEMHNIYEVGREEFKSFSTNVWHVVDQLTHPDDREHVRQSVEQTMKDKATSASTMEYRILMKDGRTKHVLGRFDLIPGQDGEIVKWIGTLEDITERKQFEEKLRASQERFDLMIQGSSDGFWDWPDTSRDHVEVTPRFFELLGYPDKAFPMGLGKFLEMLHDDDRERVRLAIQAHLEKQERYDTEYRLRTSSGKYKWFRARGQAIWDDSGAVLRMSGSIQDINERKRHTADMEYQATHDSLTGLPNREYLHITANRAIAEAGEEGKLVALMLMDLDRFKEINDTLGHQSGDKLLKQIGPRLQHGMENQKIHITRLGGDEFAILIEDIRDKQELVASAEAILDVIRQPYSIDGLMVEIGASIGVSIYPEHGDSPSSLLRSADVAMYQAKQQSLGYMLYTPEDDQHTLRRLALMTELGMAIRENQLFLEFQPIVDLGNTRSGGFEALVRWMHPTHGLIPPNQFIPIAETSELIAPLTNWVIEQALQQLQKWQKSGYQASISLNVSTRNLLDEKFPRQIKDLIKRYNVDPEHLELEITESSIMADPDRALHILSRINEIGVQLSIDDFGTGYSSLAYLKSLPIQALKIDLSFVQQMTNSLHDRTIVQSIIGLAHNLQLQVIAEGVENRETMDALKNYQCDYAQGYFFSRPMDVDSTEQWLRSRQASNGNGADRSEPGTGS